MKKIIKNVFFVALSAFALGACKAELETTPVTTNGKIDLTRYVAVGNSLTAGYADGGVYLESQQNSYPQFLNDQFAKVGGNPVFNQPLFNATNLNGSGYLVLATPGATAPTPIVAPPTSFAFTGTKLFGGGGPGTGENQLIPYAGTGNQNLGIPGIGVVHVTTKSYSLVNPFFDRLLTTAQRGNGSPLVPANGITYLDFVAASNPTFFTCWLGNNDVLGYATGGGDDAAAVGSGAITPQGIFAPSYNALVNTLTAKGAKGVLATIPDVTSLPYFTTVKESNLPTIVFSDGGVSVYGRPKTTFPGLPAVGPFFPGVGASPTAAQVASFFNALYLANGYTDPGYKPGVNFPAIIVNIPSGVRSPANPTVVKSFSAASGDLIVLPFSGVATTLFTGGGGFMSPPDLLNPAGLPNPLGDKWFLDATEIAKCKTATDGFNNTIKSVGVAKGLPVFDAGASFSEIIANNGIDGVAGNTGFIAGTLFSLDGVHLTPKGYGTIANQFIKAINAGYNTNIPLLDVRQRGLRGVRIP